MSKKPSLVAKTKRLQVAQKELSRESVLRKNTGTKQTTILLDENLLFLAKEVALNRKKAGIEPNTISGMIRNALQDIVKQELNA